MVSYMSYVFVCGFLYTIAWAFCIVRLNSKGSAKAYDWGWTMRIPTLLFVEGKTNSLSFPILGDSIGI